MERPVQELPVAWARLRVEVNCGRGRGGWYRVVQVTGAKAVLEVTPEPVPVPRRRLETGFRRPFLWSIVPRPRDARNVPSTWGNRYVGCPVCNARAPIKGHHADLHAAPCPGGLGIAWPPRELAHGTDAGAA